MRATASPLILRQNCSFALPSYRWSHSTLRNRSCRNRRNPGAAPLLAPIRVPPQLPTSRTHLQRSLRSSRLTREELLLRLLYQLGKVIRRGLGGSHCVVSIVIADSEAEAHSVCEGDLQHETAVGVLELVGR